MTIVRDITKTLGVSVFVVTLEALLFYALVYTVHELPLPCVAEAPVENTERQDTPLDLDRHWLEMEGCLVTHWEGTHYILHVCPNTDPLGWDYEVSYGNTRVRYSSVLPFERAKAAGLASLEELATKPTKDKR